MKGLSLPVNCVGSLLLKGSTQVDSVDELNNFDQEAPRNCTHPFNSQLLLCMVIRWRVL